VELPPIPPHGGAIASEAGPHRLRDVERCERGTRLTDRLRMNIYRRRGHRHRARVDDPKHLLRVQVDVDGEAFDRSSPDVFHAVAIETGGGSEAPRSFLGSRVIATRDADALDGRQVRDAPPLQRGQDLRARLGDAVLHLELLGGDVGLNARDLTPRGQRSRADVHHGFDGRRRTDDEDRFRATRDRRPRRPREHVGLRGLDERDAGESAVLGEPSRVANHVVHDPVLGKRQRVQRVTGLSAGRRGHAEKDEEQLGAVTRIGPPGEEFEKLENSSIREIKNWLICGGDALDCHQLDRQDQEAG
jgi:hypothetical protein